MSSSYPSNLIFIDCQFAYHSRQMVLHLLQILLRFIPIKLGYFDVSATFTRDVTRWYTNLMFTTAHNNIIPPWLLTWSDKIPSSSVCVRYLHFCFRYLDNSFVCIPAYYQCSRWTYRDDLHCGVIVAAFTLEVLVLWPPMIFYFFRYWWGMGLGINVV